MNEKYEVPIPSSHIGNKPIQGRLISKQLRRGMVSETLIL
jgi:hypothetical protein